MKASNVIDYYHQYKKIHNRVIIEAKKMHNDNFIHHLQNKSKAMWHLINEELGKGTNRVRNVKLNSSKSIVNDPEQVANIFNNYYVNIADNILNENPLKNRPNNVDKPINIYNSCSMFLTPVTEMEVITISKTLKKQKILQVWMKSLIT